MSKYEVIGSGESYSVVRAGVDVAGPFANQEAALGAADRMRKKDNTKRRNCISCNDEFLSEGPHNRMCDACRENPDRLIALYWGDAA